MNTIIGDRIKECRIDKHLTQKELSDLVGIPNTTISKYEKHHSLPDPYNMKALAAALDCEVSYLDGTIDYRRREIADVAEQIPLSKDAINKLVALNGEYDKYDEDDPINHESHMKVLLLNTIVEYILTPIENPPLGQPTPDELLNLSRNYLENFETIKQEGGSYARKRSKKWSDANQAMNGIEFTIGYRLGRIVGSGLKNWFSKNY